METKLEQIAAKAVKQTTEERGAGIRTPRSVGTGGGRPPPVTRSASNGRPYRKETPCAAAVSADYLSNLISIIIKLGAKS
jgi:hypothetical protein